jgi:hypothetical protein
MNVQVLGDPARASGCGPLAPPLQAACGAVGASRLSLRLAGCGDALPGNRTGMSASHEHRHVDLAGVDLYGEIEPLVRAARHRRITRRRRHQQ